MRISKTRAGLWVLATIAAPLLFYWFASGWYIGVWYAQTGHEGQPTSEIMMQAMFVGLPPALWAATGLWWWIHRKEASFSELFMTRAERPEIDLLVGLALGTAWTVVYGLGDVVSWEAMFTFDAAKLASVPATLSAGFCEEFLFRGFLFSMLLAAGAGIKSRVVVSSLAFGLAHCFWGPWGMLWTTGLGFTFGLAVIWRGNVWPAVVAHTVLDLCIEPGLIEKTLHGGFGS